MAMQTRMLPDGRRLHLNHGPIDLVIEAHGAADAVRAAYSAVRQRFGTVLEELVRELPLLRTEIPQHGLPLHGTIARSMAGAVQPHWQCRITPMAAVAGAVADHMLACMVAAAPLSRAYVNNGGDIALHLANGESFTIASPAGAILVNSSDNVRGIATSGWRGRSFSLGIADSVTVLAHNAAQADACATLIANAVDLPGSNKVKRQPAREIAPDSDLGERLVTVGVDLLDDNEVREALLRGMDVAQSICLHGFIQSCSMSLQRKHRNLDSVIPDARLDGRMEALGQDSAQQAVLRIGLCTE